MSTAPSHSGSRWAVVDFNGVIGRHPTWKHWSGLAKTSAWSGSTAELQQAFWLQRAIYDSGQLTPREFWRPLAGRGASLDQVAELDAAMWLEIDPQVLEVLQTAARDGIRLVMLSNAPVPVADLITAAPWANLFETLLFSCHLGLNKPAADAYRAALRAAGDPDPADVIFVDDREDNIAAADALHLRTHHYQGHPAHLAADLQLHGLNELHSGRRLQLVPDPV